MRRVASILVVIVALGAAVVLMGAKSGGGQSKTIKITFDNAFGLTSGGDLKIGGVKAGKTTGFLGDQHAASEGDRHGSDHAAGLHLLPQGRELPHPAAVADRRVLRGLPARHGAAAAAEQHRAGRPDPVDDPAGPAPGRDAASVPRALPADHQRAGHWARRPPAGPQPGDPPCRPGPPADEAAC